MRCLSWQERWRPRELTDREYHAEFVAPHEERRGRENHRVSVTVSPDPQPKKGGGCAGAALLFMATGTAATVAASGVWPF